LLCLRQSATADEVARWCCAQISGFLGRNGPKLHLGSKCLVRLQQAPLNFKLRSRLAGLLANHLAQILFSRGITRHAGSWSCMTVLFRLGRSMMGSTVFLDPLAIGAVHSFPTKKNHGQSPLCSSHFVPGDFAHHRGLGRTLGTALPTHRKDVVTTKTASSRLPGVRGNVSRFWFYRPSARAFFEGRVGQASRTGTRDGISAHQRMVETMRLPEPVQPF